MPLSTPHFRDKDPRNPAYTSPAHDLGEYMSDLPL